MDVKRFLDWGGAGNKILRAGRGNTQTRYILTQGAAFLNFFLIRGSPGQPFFPGPGRASLTYRNFE